MSMFSRVCRVAKKLGAKIDRPNGDCNIEAPAGMVWTCDGQIHELVGEPWDDEDMENVYIDLLERMAMGVEPCQIDDCEWCESITKKGDQS